MLFRTVIFMLASRIENWREDPFLCCDRFGTNRKGNDFNMHDVHPAHDNGGQKRVSPLSSPSSTFILLKSLTIIFLHSLKAGRPGVAGETTISCVLPRQLHHDAE